MVQESQNGRRWESFQDSIIQAKGGYKEAQEKKRQEIQRLKDTYADKARAAFPQPFGIEETEEDLLDMIHTYRAKEALEEQDRQNEQELARACEGRAPSGVTAITVDYISGAYTGRAPAWAMQPTEGVEALIQQCDGRKSACRRKKSTA